MSVTYPRANSVTERILAAFLRGDKLTVLDGWKGFHTSAFTQHVQRLKERHGWPIRAEHIEVDTADGRVSHVALYSLPVEAIEAAGETGRRIADAVQRARVAHVLGVEGE